MRVFFVEDAITYPFLRAINTAFEGHRACIYCPPDRRLREDYGDRIELIEHVRVSILQGMVSIWMYTYPLRPRPRQFGYGRIYFVKSYAERIELVE